MLSDSDVFDPPICEPRVPDEVIEPFTARDDVAIFAKVLTPEKYGMFPTTAAEEVDSPANERVGVEPPEDWIGNVPETLVTAEVRKPASLLNHDNLTDDEAIDDTSPLVPVKTKPCPKFERNNELLKVDEAVEKIPFEKPTVVDVET